MPCQRSRVLLNPAERRLLDELRVALQDHNAEIIPKVRLSDALDLNNSGISSDLFSYGTRAHLDFLVVHCGTFQSLFGIEYDGAEHFVQGDTIVRDRKKSEICRQLNFDLLRITKCQLENIFMGKTQLRILVDQWFAEHSPSQNKACLALLPVEGK